MKQEIAIIFFGLTRNLKKTYLSIKYNIFKPLEDLGIGYKVFLHTYHLESITNARSGEQHVPLDNDEWKLLRPYRYIIEDQNEVDKTLPMDEFCRYKNPWPEDPGKDSMRNMLRALHSLKQAWSLLVNERRYDAYLILRPDLQYTSPLIIDFRLPVTGKVIYLPTWGTISSGENDRLCLTSWEGACTYMRRYDHVMLYARRATPNSHRFLKWVLDVSQIERRELSLSAVRIRAFEPLTDDHLESFNVMGLYHRALRDYEKKK